MIGFFGKKTSNIPVDNGSSIKALIIKLTRQFIDITLIIETSVSVVLFVILLSYAPLVAIQNLPAIPVHPHRIFPK
jgi:hypothetical protein